MGDFQRARSQEQKEERWDEIIAATLKIFESSDYHAITLSQIAKELSFTRANLYKYVTTKEEIFLQIILRDLETWAQDVKATFATQTNLSIHEFAASWSQLLDRHRRLVELFALLHTILEKNVSLESLIHYKQTFFGHFYRLLDVIQQVLPLLRAERVQAFLQYQLMVSSGLLPATQLSELQREAIRRSGYDYEVPDFVNVMTELIAIFLTGLQAGDQYAGDDPSSLSSSRPSDRS